MNKVLIVSRQHATYRQLLDQAQLPALEITEEPEQATIILADPPRIAAHLDAYPALQWLQSTYAGIDALTKQGLRRDYTLTNIRGHFGQLIAEYVMGYTLDHIRHLSLYRQQQLSAQWQPHPYSSLANRTIVILGTGSIGAHLARVAKTFALNVIGINRSGHTAESCFDQVYPLTQLAEGLARADILVSTLPATTNTDDILNASTLSHCHNTLLFNVGRGNAVSEEGLLSAIEQGCVVHAFLDVFKHEPLDNKHPFWRHPNVTITPHIAAESFPEQVFEIFEANYQRYIRQQALMYQIDFDRGY
ncbi:D-2-hydroxyacid dehydrogenase [Photobacterium sp. SDRW27]|uniref:D-2-hydroxyacid dehydrogenase n=1 Tax=Photobacterium obscurum TaxID=2829490 RepID=UPI0022442F52|nr:D-2-hydroxyacid dehydrogenase [Photobacterium obscurum]MCW8330741.1 D-2-hydroxyacid dehydrogenase [Photobacterium obscurum]